MTKAQREALDSAADFRTALVDEFGAANVNEGSSSAGGTSLYPVSVDAGFHVNLGVRAFCVPVTALPADEPARAVAIANWMSTY